MLSPEGIMRRLMKFAGVTTFTTVDLSSTPRNMIFIGKGLGRVKQVGNVVEIPDDAMAGISVDGPRGPWTNIYDNSGKKTPYAAIKDESGNFLTDYPLEEGEWYDVRELNDARVVYHGSATRRVYLTRW